MTLLPLIISFVVLVVSSYEIHRSFGKKIQEDKISTLAKNVKKGSSIYVWGLYRTIGFFAVVFGLVLLFVPFFGFNIALFFILGLAVAAVVAYVAAIFIVKLNADISEKTVNGFIETFKSIFGGGSTLGAFVFSSALFSVSVFYAVFSPEGAEELLSFALGGVIFSIFARISGAIYMDLGELLSDDVDSNDYEQKNPYIISRFVAKNTADVIGSVAGMFEIIILGIVSAMIFASILFSSVEGAIALPLLIASVGLVASFLSSKLIHIGITTTITRSILFSVLSTLVLSAVLFSPAIIWVLGEVEEYSVLRLWGSSVLGVLSSGVLFWLSYNYSKRKMVWAKTALKKNLQEFIIKGTSLSMEAVLQYVIVIVAGVILSYWLSGLLGLVVFTVSSIVLSGVLIAINIFAVISDSAYKTSEFAELAQERIKVAEKLTSANDTLRGGVRMFLLITAIFVALVLFLYNQNTVFHNAAEDIVFAASPMMIVGMFMGGVVVYVLCSRLVYAPLKASKYIKGEIRRYINRRDESTDNTTVEYPHMIHFTTKSIMRVLMYSALFIIVSTVAVGLFFKLEALAGFLMGVLLVGGCTGIFLILNGNLWASARGLRDDRLFEENVLLGRHYRNITSVGVVTLIKTSALVGLFVSIFIL